MESSTPQHDRRSVERIVLEAPWFADAVIGERACQVTIIDFSNAGAKVQTVHGETGGPYQTGQPCEFNIHLPSGKKMPVKALLNWSFRLPEGSLIGVQFIDSVDPQILREVYECSLVKRTETAAG